MHQLIHFIAFISLIKVGGTILAYDCGAKVLNLTTISLLEVGPCVLPDNTATSEEVDIQLLQMVEFTQLPVIQCKIEIYREVKKCSKWFNYLIPVENSVQTYIMEIGRDACDTLHQLGSIQIGTKTITGVQINKTQTYSHDFAGSASESECNGAPYSDYYGSWSKVLVQGTITINLIEYTAEANLNDDYLHLNSGTRCKLSDTKCVDMEGGNTFWKPLPAEPCDS